MTVTPFDSLTITFEVSWTTTPFASPSYTDESAYVRSWSLKRGRTSQFDQFTAGTLTVELENSSRRFDPTYTAGALFGNLLPRKKCRLSATYSAVTYRLFTGYLDGLPQSGEMSNTLGTATLTASDGFKMLARTKLPTGDASVGDGDTITQRIGRLLNYAAWPVADRDIDTNTPTIIRMLEDGSPLLEEVYTVTNGDLGQVFIAGDGDATYRGHLWQLQNNLTAAATVGDSTGEIPYTDCVFTYDDTTIFNRAIANSFTGDESAGFVGPITSDIEDATSVTAYGESVKDLGNIPPNNLNVVQNTLEFVLAYYKDAKLRCTQLSFNPRRSPSTMYPVVLGGEIGTRWTFKRRPQNVGTAISQDVIVEGISHSMTPDSFTSTFDLSEAATTSGGGSYWILGTSTWGTSTTWG